MEKIKLPLDPETQKQFETELEQCSPLVKQVLTATLETLGERIKFLEDNRDKWKRQAYKMLEVWEQTLSKS